MREGEDVYQRKHVIMCANESTIGYVQGHALLFVGWMKITVAIGIPDYTILHACDVVGKFVVGTLFNRK